MPPQALAALSTLLSLTPHGNRLDLQLDHGAAEMVWISPSAFRFRRTLEGPLPAVLIAATDAVALDIDETPGAFHLRSSLLDVTIQKHGVILRVRRLDGTPLMADLTEPAPAGTGVQWERQTLPGIAFYGLGPRTDPGFDLRGRSHRSDVPFLLSTAGYGEFHSAKASYRFDFTLSDRYRIEAPSVDYYFYYGPQLKQILEEHAKAQGPSELWPAAPGRFGSWEMLRTALLRLVHGALSGMLQPTFDLRPFAAAPPELRERARQLGSLVPDVNPGVPGLSDFRQSLSSFYETYAAELGEKGYPAWHPLPFQFPDDPNCARYADEFMLGDEMLVAPIYQPGEQRDVYLPQGLWTNLETNETLPGRRTVTVRTTGLPVYVRNGMIVPFDTARGMALHYFPKLGAEFFILEEEINAWTQVHAAPAADIMRLEIESKKDRDYEWIVHHVDAPAGVAFEDVRYRRINSAAALADRTWFYDSAARNLHVRLHVKAGEDAITNLSW
jgi:hypothetical protein